MSNETVARRYAAALADVVTKSGETETVRNELKTWQEMINSSGDLKNALHNPSIPHQSKEKVLTSLLERAKPTTTTANFLRVLLSNDRLTDLGEINDRFAHVLEERSGVILADITSARPLGETEKSELQSNLEKLTGKKINLNFKINEDLIGGIVTRIGSTVYDNSVKTQLENLKEQIING